MNMKLSTRGYAVLKDLEGLRLVAYRCSADKLTIGWGHTGPEVVEGLHWTLQQAIDTIVADVAKFEKAINASVRTKLTQPQFDALVIFTFNVGVSAFSNSTMRRLLNEGSLDKVPAQFNRWNKETVAGVLRESVGLTRRRTAERELFESTY